jgi:hypothetical protein
MNFFYLPKEVLDREILEKQRDVEFFRQAYSLVCSRLRASAERGCKVLPLHEWSGAQGLKLIMEPTLNSMQRVVEELKEIREQAYPEDAQVPAAPAPLKLVE